MKKALILLTEQGYIKRMPVNTFEARRATRGKAAARVKEMMALNISLPAVTMTVFCSLAIAVSTASGVSNPSCFTDQSGVPMCRCYPSTG